MTSVKITGELAGTAAAIAVGPILAVEGAGPGSGATARLGRSLFGKDAILNSNRYLRIGYGRRGGEKVFRVAGELVRLVAENGKLDIWRIGPL